MTQVLNFKETDMFGAIGEGAVSHELVRNGEAATLCGKVATHGIKGTDLPRCASCVKVSDDIEAKLTAGAQSVTMGSPTIEGETVPKSDAILTDGDDVEAQISANTERVKTLRSEGNAEAAEALYAETEEMISTQIKGRGAAGKKAALRKPLNDARKTPLPESEDNVPATLETVDIDAIPGVSGLIDRAVAKSAESATQMRKVGESAREVAAIYLDLRLASRNRAGLPDLVATSRGYRDTIKRINDKTLEGVDVADIDRRSSLDAVRKGVGYQLSTLLVDFLRALDTSDRSEVAKFFPMLELPSEGSLTEAVYSAYAGRGIELPRKSEKEIKADRARAKALEAAQNAEALEAAEDDDDDDSNSPRMEQLSAKSTRVQKSIDGILSSGKKLEGDEKEALRSWLTDLATKLIADAAKL
jgi:hypothetical protein